MRRALAAASAALAASGVVTAAPTIAGVSTTTTDTLSEPRCLFHGDWDCEGPPRYNGPLQNTWSHGLTSMPQICPGDASMQPCSFYVPEP
jgi:hypothetical protein